MATIKLGDINRERNHIDITKNAGKVEPVPNDPNMITRARTISDPVFNMEDGVTNIYKGPPIENKEDTPPEENVSKIVKPVQTGHVDLSAMKPVNSSDILPPKQVEPSQMEMKLLDNLDRAVEREKKQIERDQAAIMEKMYEEYMEMKNEEKTDNVVNEDWDNEGEEVDEDVDDYIPPNMTPNFDEDSDELMDDDFLKDSDTDEDEENYGESLTSDELEQTFSDKNKNDDTDEEENADDIIKDVAMQVKEKVTSTIKRIDLTSFKISKKPISATNAMKISHSSRANTADWILPAAKRSATYKGLKGTDIINLSPRNSNKNRLNTFRDIYKILYDNIVDPNKPDFESWLKLTRFSDVNHIYFGYYIATFTGTNFIHYACDNKKCKKKVFIKDVEFKDMVKYRNEKAEKKYKNMLSKDSTSGVAEYPVELYQISDNYVVGIRTPSIWNVIIETASLSDEFIEKYSDLIDTITYIDEIYAINYNTNELERVDTKPDKNNQTKTAARKIRIFNDILKTLTPDQFYLLREAINNLDDENDDITYQIPSAICPCCATEIPAKEMSPDEMLFTRHQLGAFVSMPNSSIQ